jgi:hypothetical protein
MFNKKFDIHFQLKSEIKRVADKLIENNIPFVFKTNLIEIETHYVNIRIDKNE